MQNKRSIATIAITPSRYSETMLWEVSMLEESIEGDQENIHDPFTSSVLNGLRPVGEGSKYLVEPIVY